MSEAREELEVDVLFVGGGPAGLAGAIRLMQLIESHNQQAAQNSGEPLDEPMIAIIEKGGHVGSHQISGAVLDPVALRELIPDFLDQGAPLQPVTGDEVLYLTRSGKLKAPVVPPFFQNHGNFVCSLNRLTKWLEGIAEGAGVNLFPEFPGAELLYEGDRVIGVRTGDKGLDKNGERKANFEPGYDLKAKVTVLCEGSRGSLTKGLVERFGLQNQNPQIYEIGVKELWEVPGSDARKGHVIHSAGFPLSSDVGGGGFIYFLGDNLVSLGLVMGLEYHDPRFDPHRAFQTWKTHPFVAEILKGGQIVRYGAKTLPVGGYWSLPDPVVDGALLAGDAGGFLNIQRLKGIHLAMKTGMLAAETALEALVQKDSSKERLGSYRQLLKDSFVNSELYKGRNFHAAVADGVNLKAMFHIGLQMMTGGRGWKDRYPVKAGHSHLQKRGQAGPAPDNERFQGDGKLTFDKLTNVFQSGTIHEEDQPCHLQVADTDLCRTRCREEYGNPCENFCPANVYEMVAADGDGSGEKVLQINASNCVHCKTCDIMDPYQVITWVTPEGGGGPVYTDL
jgi:electron-transferring-flavoprotein dehydrogenase